MILAKLKDLDIAARPKGEGAGIPDAEIERMLQSMIKQRRESAELYDKGGRPELAEPASVEEIGIIEGFLPQQMSDAETWRAQCPGAGGRASALVGSEGHGARSWRRCGSAIAGRMDFGEGQCRRQDGCSA